ncbi:response regulator transcription factor [Candidatus Gracilibacteria bacterium]|nr:response regulator transcription factor [Candidatus Gracilibacteria bacterium]
MKKRILLVEDNTEISENIREYLELEDFEVVQAFDGERGIERATREDYDLILLDLMLPEVDGISIARRVALKKDTPVIMITARESLSDRLLGFDVGAVDYLVKPFELSELLARMKVHLGRNCEDRVSESEVFSLGDIEVNLAKHQFIRDGEMIHLTQKEFLIIKYLIEKKDQVIPRGEIIETLWGEDEIFEKSGDNKLDVYISNIRSKLGKTVIKTVKSVGYTLGA